jgi:hypothetical protein
LFTIGNPVPRIPAWHSPTEDRHHDNTECYSGALIPEGMREPGDGGKSLCKECAALNRAEAATPP